MICKHCTRILAKEGDIWIDPEATGDDSVWRETCDSNHTFIANHEPVSQLEWEGIWSLGKQSDVYFDVDYKGMHCEMFFDGHTWGWSFYDDNSLDADLAVARGESADREVSETELIDYIDSYVVVNKGKKKGARRER